MNHFPDEFFRHCFIPWLQCLSIDHVQFFFSNLFTRITKPSARNQLCTYLCQNSTCSWNDNELTLISHWLDSKDFYFSSDLFEYLPEKCAISAPTYPSSLLFAKVLHKVLVKSSEHNQLLSVEQRSALKEAILVNTTILSDILLDLLDWVSLVFQMYSSILLVGSIFLLSTDAGLLPTVPQNDHKSRVLDAVSAHSFLVVSSPFFV